ncbi:RNA pseudouridylate synthase domain-containing protein 1 isoform X1 [Astyanax mexicanus]|uniref:RNA pseudouridylate synthase domain-containing protein 1 isoform X1 n=2 Tax=Astyanax mexicanus TaxID=7994 RepID=A0A8T2L3V8_ASTMX|nr:RNA pseudouridylate synthase domain-containing protein 1 isoform X1 [Astyanax mexicanus]
MLSIITRMCFSSEQIGNKEVCCGAGCDGCVQGEGSMEEASLDRLCVLYHSENYLVVNKHWDIRIDSKFWAEERTVQKQLKHHFPDLADPATYYGFRFCHQLDFSTSGALCVALNKAAAGRAYHFFKNRLVTKAYLALVRGSVPEEKLMIDFAIGKNSTEGKTHMMCVEETEGCENPKPSQTELTVLEYGVYDGDPVTKVLLQPRTGRTHQLRVHCSAIGHPIVGDYTYSLGSDNSPYRMMLHAYMLQIPLEHEPLQVTAPDPFLPTTDPKWSPQTVLLTVDCVVEGILERSRAKQTESPKHNVCERRSSPEETEESRVQCQQWLSEWSLD